MRVNADRCANKRVSALVGLLRDCCPRGLEDYESRRSHLVDHRLNNNRRHPNALHIERGGSTRREIEDASASVWTPVVDFDDDGGVGHVTLMSRY